MAILSDDLLLIQQAGEIFKLKYSSLKDDVLNGVKPVAIGPTAPISPDEGDLWFDTIHGRLFIFFTDADSSQWVDASPPLASEGGASVGISPNPPLNPEVGDLWFNSVEGKMYIYYKDSTSSQWVETNPSGIDGDTGIDIPSLPPLPI